MYDLIIIGGGPAGLTAAIYAVRKRLNFLLISKDLGGKTNFYQDLPWAAEYDQSGFDAIRGLEIVNNFKSELDYLKFARKMEAVQTVARGPNGFVVITGSGEQLETKAVIVASGTEQKRLNAPGESDFRGKGLSYSAMSYAPFFIDKKTVVAGEGELALRAAAELAVVAKQVHLVGIKPEILDSPLGHKLQSAANVTLLPAYQVTAIRGNKFVAHIEVKSPQGEEQTIEVDGIFVEQGLVPNSGMVAGLVDLDANGRIVTDCTAKTSVPGIFAAGDVTDIYAEQVLVAIGEGAKALLSAFEYLLPTLA